MKLQFEGFQFIVADPAYCDGQPRIEGTRITVAAILTYLAGGMTVENIVAEFPKLSKEKVNQAIAFAAANFRDSYLPLKRVKTAAA